MTDHVRNEYIPSEVSPPGDTLREVLEERGWAQTDLAVRMGRPKKTISEIINGKAQITPETALQLELVLGIPASFWTTRESHYREYLAKKHQDVRLAAHKSWLAAFPVRQMVKLGWMPSAPDTPNQVRHLLEFFGVAAPEQWESTFRSCEVAFRRSPSFVAQEEALSAWLRAGERQAEALSAAPFDKRGFFSALQNSRALTTEAPEAFRARLIEMFSQVGVVVAFVPELPGSRVSGATRWLTADKALIQLSLRYKTDDHLWFTFFHEAAHIALHGKHSIFLEENYATGDLEEEANRFAADFLIPPAAYREFTRDNRRFSKAAIQAFAEGVGIAPGVVVGRLQHDRLLPHSHCNDLKRRFEWKLSQVEH